VRLNFLSFVIGLNAKLLFLPPKLMRYVLRHELCHTLERNHNSRFWTHLRQLELQIDLLHGQIGRPGSR
jgi:predicted metal-dependent hydrolase